jgi:hypothetical protein
MLPLCRWPFPRLCGFPSAGPSITGERSTTLSSSFALLLSLPQRTLADRPQPTSSSHGLSLPSAHEGSEVHSPRVCRARYVPPAGFGYPLGGLLPPSPCRLCFTPAALLGFTLRSLPLPQGIRRVSTRKHPRTVSPAVAPVAEASGRPGRPRFLGFDPRGSPWRPARG